jgi:hypothetical protein
LPIAGGTVTGPITLAADPANPLEAATKQYIDAKPTGIGEAPTDGQLYGRKSATWAVVPAGGGGGGSARVFNAIGNPSFEVTQRNCGGLLTNPGNDTIIEDRWRWQKTAPFNCNVQVVNTSLGADGGIISPGSNFSITRSFFRITNQATVSPTASDYLQITQFLEGIQLRELMGGPHSLSILARSSVASLSFGITWRDPSATRSLSKLATLSATANSWTLVTLANMPAFPSAGATFSIAPGQVGGYLGIVLTAGSGNLPPANDAWQSGNFIGAVGQSNFAASSVGSTLDIAFLQHEPGAVCNPLADIDFDTNYEACLRYFSKSAPYATKPGTDPNGAFRGTVPNTSYNVQPAVVFPRIMAKSPNVTITNYAGLGAASVSSITNNEREITKIVLSASQTGIYSVTFSWYADTGW